MGKVTKVAKKFAAKHLEGTINRRKKTQVVKRTRQQQEAVRASKRAAAEDGSGDEDEAGQPKKPLEDMSMDEFLSGGFLEAPAAGPASDDDDEASDSDDELDSESEDGSEGEGGKPAVAAPSASKKQAKQQAKQQAVAAAAAAAGRKRKGEQASPAAAPASDSEGDSEGEDASDSEDEEGGEGEGKAVGRKAAAGGGGGKAALKAEMFEHKAQLEKLRQQDPEFYAYLKSTDKELLNFGKDSDDEMDSADEEEQEDGDEEEKAEQEDADAAPEAGGQHRSGVTLAMVDGWCQAAKDKASIGACRHIIKAYRVACHYGDSEEQVEESMRIASSAVYNKLMLFVLREIDGIFRRMLMEGATPKQQEAPLTAAAMVRLPRWRKVEPLVKSYLGNTLHLLGALTDGAMLTFILRRIRASTVMLAPYDKLQRRLLKAALGLFGSADNAPRVQAILLVRQMAMDLPQPALDNCLKGVYRAFSSNAKFVNAASVPQINFMAAAVVEMYGINTAASYQHAFSFIRQLAVLLRSALTNKSKEAYREVYCWQTINCLELWAKLLAAKADEPELRPLIYPVTQVLLGVARLVPAPAFFPLRLRCARALNRLGEATHTFIPVAPVLLEVLQWGDLRKAPKPGPVQHPDVLLLLRVSKAAMRSSPYQEEIINQVMELLAEHLACWGCHIAFPELSFLTLAQLRKFAKNTPVDRFRKAARQLIEAVERNVVFVGRARDQVDFSPKDLAQVANFLGRENDAKQAPIQQYAATLLDRARQRVQMRLADEVELGGNGPAAAAAVEDDSDDEDAVPTGSLLPKKQQRQVASEEAEGAPAAKRQKASAAAVAGAQRAQQEGSEDEGQSDGGAEVDSDGDEDVRPYQMSDDEDEGRGGYAAPEFDGSEGDDDEDEDEDESGEDAPRPKQMQNQQQQMSDGRGGRGGGRSGGRDGGRGGGRDGGRGGGRFGRGGGRGRDGGGRGGGGRGRDGGGRGGGRAGGRGGARFGGGSGRGGGRDGGRGGRSGGGRGRGGGRR